MKLISVALVIVVLLSANDVVVDRPVQAIGLIESFLARSVLRTISLKQAERRDRSNINKRRDAELQEIELRIQAVDVQESRGWLTSADAERESERYQDLRRAVEERAKRERQVASFQTRQRIRRNLASTLTDVLKVSTGADPRAIDFFAGLLRGERPLAAAVEATIGGGTPVTDPRQQFRDLQETLRGVETTARALRGARGLAIRARVQQALHEATGLSEYDGPPPDDKIARLKDLEQQIQSAVSQIVDIRGDLFPRSEGIDRERFATNERWQQLDATVSSLEGPLAGRAIVSGTLRATIAEATRLANEADFTLSPEEMDEITTAVISTWINERRSGTSDLKAGESSIEELVREAFNEHLAIAGQPPLPSTTPSPEAEERVVATTQPTATPTATPEQDTDRIAPTPGEETVWTLLPPRIDPPEGQLSLPPKDSVKVGNEYTVDQTSIIQKTYFDTSKFPSQYGDWNVTATFTFDQSPPTIKTGEVFALKATGTLTKSGNIPWARMGYRLSFASGLWIDNSLIREGEDYPRLMGRPEIELEAYEAKLTKSSGSVTVSFVVPEAHSQDIAIQAKVGNVSVTWIYRVE